MKSALSFAKGRSFLMEKQSLVMPTRPIPRPPPKLPLAETAPTLLIPAWPVPRQPPKLRLAEAASTPNWTIFFQVLRSYWDRQWVRFALLITFGIGARLPALQGQLLWDDTHLVLENPFIRSPLLILETFRHSLFPDSLGGHYRPVQTISYIFDYLLWNGESYGFHVSSVLWHVLGACLLYMLLRKLVRSAG